ncbi:hypothetical protein NBRC10513v2_003240 [Rhodotorula toruloides]
MAYSNPVRLITDDPLRLLPLFACFFAAWDNHLALDSPRKDFFWTTLALLMNWYNFWNYIDPLNVLFERPVRWLSREEMRVRLAMRGHGLAPQAGWEVMLHHLLLNAVELLEEQWQLIPLPAHLSRLRLRFRITRWRTTFAFVLSSLALALCVARRTLIGKGYYWPLWDIPLLLLFKRTQPAPYLNLDSTVQAKGNQFVETATTAILDSRLAGVDVGNAAIQFIRLRAASVMMCEAETELHEVILEAVLAQAPGKLCDFSTFCNLFRLLPSYVVLYRHL